MVTGGIMIASPARSMFDEIMVECDDADVSGVGGYEIKDTMAGCVA